MRHELRRSRSRFPRCCALLLAAALPLACNQSPTAPDSAKITETATATAKVVSVDKAARTVVLRNERGETMRVRCGPDVRNFDQINAGDTVRAEYQVAIALALKKADDLSSDVTLDAAAGRAPVGATPAAAVGAQVTATVRIEAVDNENHIVVFTPPSGGLQAVHIKRPESREFARGLKKGDVVQVTYSEALALRVDKQ